MPSSTFVIRCLLLILSLLYAAEASKLQSNITIALIGPYSLLPGLNYHGFEVIGGLAQVNASRINPNSPQGVHYFDHIFGEMAIDDVNSNPTTFPNTTVLVRRFTDTTSSKAPPGGYAIALANYINDSHSDIIAIFGGYLSTTSKFEAEVYGAYNLPYAGSTQVAPLFSDKSNYPYFIRSAAALGFANCVTSVLQKWNVRQAAIIFEGTDVLSAGIAQQVSRTLQANNILLQTYFNLKTNYDQSDFKRLKETLRRTDARYILLITTRVLVTPLYMSLSNEGISVGRGYTWISKFLLDQGYLVSMSRTNTSVFLAIRGFMVVSFGQVYTPTMTDKYKNLQQRLNQKISYWGKNVSLTSEMIRSYDIMMVLLQGLYNVLQANPLATPEMLASRQLNAQLNYSAFMHTGYRGVTADPCDLTDTGDAAVPFQLYYYAGTYFAANDSLLQVTFGETDIDGNNFHYLSGELPSFGAIQWGNKPMFADGTDIPPTDNSVDIVITESIIPILSVNGLIILILEALGLLLCVFCGRIIIKYSNHQSIRSSAPNFMMLILVGISLSYLSMSLVLGRITNFGCHFQSWLLFLSVTFISASMISKNIRVYRIYTSRGLLRKSALHSWSYVLLFSGVVAYTIIVLSMWSFLGSPRATKLNLSLTQFTFVCIRTSNGTDWITYFIWVGAAAHLAALLSLSYVTRYVGFEHSESGILALLVVMFPLMFLVLVFVQGSQFRHSLSIWAASTIILASFFGAKVIEVMSDRVVNVQILYAVKSPRSSTTQPSPSTAKIRLKIERQTSYNELSASMNETDAKSSIADAKDFVLPNQRILRRHSMDGEVVNRVLREVAVDNTKSYKKSMNDLTKSSLGVNRTLKKRHPIIPPSTSDRVPVINLILVTYCIRSKWQRCHGWNPARVALLAIRSRIILHLRGIYEFPSHAFVLSPKYIMVREVKRACWRLILQQPFDDVSVPGFLLPLNSRIF